MSLTSDPPLDRTTGPQAEAASAIDYGALTVVPVRHPWRWAAVVATAVLLAQFVHGLVTNPGWDWDVFARVLHRRDRSSRPSG